MRAVFIQTKYECKIIDLDRTSIAGAIENHGGFLRIYYDNSSGSIIAMTQTDILDTFVQPAIDLLVSGTESNNTAGTYTVTDSSSAASNYTVVDGSNPIFTDTRADTSAYSADGIPETLDQPTTITNYYLHRRNAVASTPGVFPVLIDGTDLKQMNNTLVDSELGSWLRYWAAASDDGYKIVYTMATSGGPFLSR